MSNINELSFEDAYNELEDVIHRLESNELPLDDMVDLFERGQKLSAHCQKLLDDAALRVQKIADDGSLNDL